MTMVKEVAMPYAVRPEGTWWTFEQADLRYPDTETVKKSIYRIDESPARLEARNRWGMSYDLDIALFAESFKLNILEASYGIKH